MEDQVRKQSSRAPSEEEANSWDELLSVGPDLYFRRRIIPLVEKLYKYVYGWVRNREEAEDITQDALMKASQALRNYFHTSYKSRIMVPWPWLKKIAFNLISDYWKRLRLTRRLSDLEDILIEIEDQSMQPHEVAEQRESWQELLELVNNLSENHRIVIELHYFRSLKHKQIAEVLGCTEGNARQRVKRAVDELRKLWHQKQDK